MNKRPLQVRFVGSGDAFGTGGCFQACILLHAAGHIDDVLDVLLDCGASSLVALKQQRYDPARIGLVVVSHLHGDHFGGVPFLVWTASSPTAPGRCTWQARLACTSGCTPRWR